MKWLDKILVNLVVIIGDNFCLSGATFFSPHDFF